MRYTDKKNYIGMVFKYLTVIEEVEPKIYIGKKYKTTVRMLKCKCICDNVVIIGAPSLVTKNTLSCGCYNKESATKRFTKHNCCREGGVKEDTYHIWSSMKSRCYNPNNKKYRFYGGRGITVCEEWRDKENGFINFIEDMGFKPQEEYSIDRIENNKEYSRDNCRWASKETQYRNKSNVKKVIYNNKEYTITELAKTFNIRRSTLFHRIFEYGWKIETAIHSPISQRIKNRNNPGYIENNIIIPATEKVFTEKELSQLQTNVHKITGDGEVMILFNKLLGVNTA